MKKLSNNRRSAVYQLTATVAAIMLGFCLGIFATATATTTTHESTTDYKTIAIFLKDIIIFEIENDNESLEETYFDGLANMDCYTEYNSIRPKDVDDLPRGILTK